LLEVELQGYYENNQKEIFTMMFKRMLSLAMLTTLTLGTASFTQQAHAGYYDRYGNHHSGQKPTRYYDSRRHAWFSYKTGKIVKGGLIGAGIGVGTGLLFDRNVGKTALAGAGIGAGTQAIRYSDTMQRHPIIKTGAYGALAGAGVSAVTGHKLGKGALLGGALGTGLGALKNY
jgi:hypothetical protein